MHYTLYLLITLYTFVLTKTHYKTFAENYNALLLIIDKYLHNQSEV